MGAAVTAALADAVGVGAGVGARGRGRRGRRRTADGPMTPVSPISTTRVATNTTTPGDLAGGCPRLDRVGVAGGGVGSGHPMSEPDDARSSPTLGCPRRGSEEVDLGCSTRGR